jgi:hypothetical protein
MLVAGGTHTNTKNLLGKTTPPKRLPLQKSAFVPIQFIKFSAEVNKQAQLINEIANYYEKSTGKMPDGTLDKNTWISKTLGNTEQFNNVLTLFAQFTGSPKLHALIDGMVNLGGQTALPGPKKNDLSYFTTDLAGNLASAFLPGFAGTLAQTIPGEIQGARATQDPVNQIYPDLDKQFDAAINDIQQWNTKQDYHTAKATGNNQAATQAAQKLQELTQQAQQINNTQQNIVEKSVQNAQTNLPKDLVTNTLGQASIATGLGTSGQLAQSASWIPKAFSAIAPGVIGLQTYAKDRGEGKSQVESLGHAGLRTGAAGVQAKVLGDAMPSVLKTLSERMAESDAARQAANKAVRTGISRYGAGVARGLGANLSAMGKGVASKASGRAGIIGAGAESLMDIYDQALGSEATQKANRDERVRESLLQSGMSPVVKALNLGARTVGGVVDPKGALRAWQGTFSPFNKDDLARESQRLNQETDDRIKAESLVPIQEAIATNLAKAFPQLDTQTINVLAANGAEWQASHSAGSPVNVRNPQVAQVRDIIHESLAQDPATLAKADALMKSIGPEATSYLVMNNDLPSLLKTLPEKHQFTGHTSWRDEAQEKAIKAEELAIRNKQLAEISKEREESAKHIKGVQAQTAEAARRANDQPIAGNVIHARNMRGRIAEGLNSTKVREAESRLLDQQFEFAKNRLGKWKSEIADSTAAQNLRDTSFDNELASYGQRPLSVPKAPVTKPVDPSPVIPNNTSIKTAMSHNVLGNLYLKAHI